MMVHEGESPDRERGSVQDVRHDCEKETVCSDCVGHGGEKENGATTAVFARDSTEGTQEQDAHLDHGIEDEDFPWDAFGTVRAEAHPGAAKKMEESKPSLPGNGADMKAPADYKQDSGPWLQFGKFKAEPRPVKIKEQAKEESPAPCLKFGRFKVEPLPGRSLPMKTKKAEEEPDLAELGPAYQPENYPYADPEMQHDDDAEAGLDMPTPLERKPIPGHGVVPNDEGKEIGQVWQHGDEEPEVQPTRHISAAVRQGTVEPQPKRRRLVMDAVVLPKLEDVPGSPVTRPQESIEEINEKLRKMQNPKIKKKDGLAFSIDTVRERLRPVGFDPYPIELDMDTRHVLVSRKFLSMHYGGSMQDTFPKPGKKFRPVDGVNRQFLCQKPDYHSNAPEMPGSPGLYYDACAGGPAWPMEGNYTVFTRITNNPALWQYQGEYQLTPAPSFTKQEWASEGEKLRLTWARALSQKSWGRIIRARVYLRRTLGREFTREELEAESERDETETYVGRATEDEIGQAFLQGKESLTVWTMKCVGYDAAFQTELARRFPTWIPPPPKRKPGSKPKAAPKGKSTESTRSRKKSEPKDTKVGNKRKRADTDVESDMDKDDDEDIVRYQDKQDEDEDEEEVPVYRPRGMRSRPIELD
ncbi:hypothetical protein LshimejAT787_0101660 [Lyophyllum shimeji]|uniref:DUF6697 domain-containing protein n=1 Tax=Lyophyllum shimeji TaxID=47721 RepID=A0A9P3UHT6_LYOSH|nr:hypothetical protein LshimejAT787_0101660 [Lyophyllum shimeji]